MKFEIIKQTPFTFNKEGKEVKGVAYTVAHKARVIQASTINFEEGELVADGNTLNVKTEVELVKKPYTNGLGEVINGLQLVPKMDLDILDI